MKTTMSLCANRHAMPDSVGDSVFPHYVKNPTDLIWLRNRVADSLQGITHLDLYVTGLTVALVEVIKFCIDYNVELILWHFDSVTRTYFPQRVCERKESSNENPPEK